MKKFGIYIHWPFCEFKCPYCDFNSHVSESFDHGFWRDAYLRELDRFFRGTKGRTVTSIFFGGGTPSLMASETVESIIRQIKRLWHVSSNLEVSAEANPSSAEIRKFEAFRAAGVNRLSLGMQSLKNDTLAFLGRRHSSEDGIRAAQEAAQVFDRYSMDFIYAVPNQTVLDWRSELDKIIDLAGGHLSLYQLTVEPGTQFHRDRVPMASEKIAQELYYMTRQMLSAAGLEGYEISNYARLGQECRHNLLYWQGEDYLGVGPGAHGRVSVRADENKFAVEAVQEIRQPSAWLSAVQSGKGGTQKRILLSKEERFEELILMGLRLTEGINLERFERIFGEPLLKWLDKTKLGRLINGGFLTQAEDRIVATVEGRQRLNAVLAALIA